ncbi:MAG: hypothetical protein RIE56_07125 [Amphiplicatus sp.]
MNWQRAFDDMSAGAAERFSAFGKLGPRARRRLKRDGVLGAGALAAMIAAANASEGAGDAQFAAADADAVDSLDDILSFAAVCATGGSGLDSEFHALHESANGHEAHAFFEAAFASRFDSAFCGDDESAHQGHGARAANNAHETHTEDHGAVAMLAAHAGHGEARAASGEHAAHGAEADRHEQMGAEEHEHDGAAQPFAAGGQSAHGAEASRAQHAAAQSHAAHDAYDPYVLSALAGAQQNGAEDDGDVSAGLDALLGQNPAATDAGQPVVVAPAPAVSHDSHAYSSQDYAAQELPPVTAEV